MSRYNLRFGVNISTDMPPVVANVIQFVSAGMLVEPVLEAPTKTRNAVACYSNVLAYASGDGKFLGFAGAIAYAFEPSYPVIAECRMVDWEEVLVYNLPVDRMQIIDLIAEQLAALEHDTVNISYDTLPDPGSFITAFENNL